MLNRELQAEINEALEENPAVVLLGPRQVGKTTLAHDLLEARDAIYLDLERHSDLAKLADPELYLMGHLDKLVILDEVHRLPELFQTLRGLIDQARRDGKDTGRYLLLGSASMELMNQSSESLAGRVAYRELTPILASELDDTVDEATLWARGGFPRSLLAKSDRASLQWRNDFISTYLERDIPQLGPRVPADMLRRFWTMLAHQQGGLFNAADLARALGVDSKTVANYRDLMIDLLLVRRLTPWYANTKKRLVKSPKIYVRDSGICHALLGLDTHEALLGHPVIGGSWEGFVIENLIAAGRLASHQVGFYRTSAGAEIDLVIERGKQLWAVEIKRTASPKLSRGFRNAVEDLRPTRSFYVYSGTERYPLAEGVEAIGLSELMRELSAAAGQ
ncbi:ATP-binding protein [uncultured Maricaulis sp.]|uniref:ATP-binding protein n=1 Tax=uncultured Maricaulis sp. TaxID=174710 RepID=UPI0030DD680A|tara:strand:+ start:40229 stop:41404 length:1176 start_codon:yes stop_codon:yes gene_type:complete